MRVIGVTCSARPDSTSGKLVREVLRGAADAGHETILFEIAKGDLHGCTGCHACKNDSDRMCVQTDVLTPYFEALRQAGALVVGAGVYMGYPQGEAWEFMNRHFCLNREVMSGCRVPAGIKLLGVFAQGAPDNPRYRANYDALLEPFDGWGFERLPVLVSSGPLSDTLLAQARQTGRAL